MKKSPFLIFLLFFSVQIMAQLDSTQLAIFRAHEDTLEILADGMLNDQEEERLFYCEKFITQLVGALKVPDSYLYEFKNFQNISILPSGDDQFRIFTWQLEVATGEYRYYGAIQYNQQELALIPLIDRSFNISNPEIEVLTNDQWFGAVYYNIMPFEHNRQPAYLLFGYDSHDYLNRRKILDVLTFDEDSTAVFGAPVFHYSDELIHHRVLLTFAASANIRLNFDDKLGMIVFDHLIKDSDETTNQMVPDGSYSGFKYESGKWNFIEKIFDQVSDAPPHEVPLPEEKLKLVKPDPTKRKYD